MLFGFEMAGQRLPPRRSRLLLRRGLLGILLGGLGASVERAPRIAFHRRCRGERGRGRRGLSLFALRYGEQLRHPLVEPRKLTNELSDLTCESSDLEAQLAVLPSQSLKLVHPSVKIIFRAPCRSPLSTFREKFGDTSRGGPR